MTQKMTRNNERIASQSAFLAALYPDVPDKLWLELRCIQPATGEVRLFWAQPGSAKQRENMLQQADELNAAGFGVYFAPCLRKEKKGSAAAAALVPALWVDIDRTEVHDLEKLKAFDPAPSLIVSSGGGWHAYWLLDTPFLLKTDAQKTQIAALLHGLFAALGGDAAYVKSVASVMRLPGSINTKPDRDSAVVQITDWHPERRYVLNRFDWLATEPQTNGHALLFSANGNGHHPLPPRTEHYLVSGAQNGSRNAELFAAACQMRDAGYSQSDAERELIVRHIAAGNGGEPAAARDKEARATIASAYRQPPREPISAPKEHARQVVDQLVGRFEVEQKAERPTTQQIVEAVEACIRLNAVEWAEERQRLKALCGDGLKVSDIDRLYNQWCKS